MSLKIVSHKINIKTSTNVVEFLEPMTDEFGSTILGTDGKPKRVKKYYTKDVQQKSIYYSLNDGSSKSFTEKSLLANFGKEKAMKMFIDYWDSKTDEEFSEVFPGYDRMYSRT